MISSMTGLMLQRKLSSIQLTLALAALALSLMVTGLNGDSGRASHQGNHVEELHLEENGWRPSSECVNEGFGCKETNGSAGIYRRQEIESMCVKVKTI